MPLDSNTPVVVQTANPATFLVRHETFCTVIKDRDSRLYQKIVEKIPSEHIISFLQAQTIDEKPLFQWILTYEHWYNGKDLMIIRDLLSFLPLKEETTLFLKNQGVLAGIAGRNKENTVHADEDTETTIIAVLKKIPARQMPTFLHDQSLKGSWYSSMSFIIWLYQSSYFKAMDVIFDNLSREARMPFLKMQFIFENSRRSNIFEWAMNYKNSLPLVHLLKKIPGYELALLKTITEWTIANYQKVRWEEIFEIIFNKVPSSSILDLFQDAIPQLSYWNNSIYIMIQLLTQNNTRPLETSLEKNNLLILLIKNMHDFLTEAQHASYMNAITYLYSKLNSVFCIMVNHKNNQGNTALHYATELAPSTYKTSLIEVLLDTKAAVSLLNDSAQKHMFTHQRVLLYNYILNKKFTYDWLEKSVSWGIEEVYIAEQLLSTGKNIENSENDAEELKNQQYTVSKIKTANWKQYKSEIQKVLLFSFPQYKFLIESMQLAKDPENEVDVVSNLISDYTLPYFDDFSIPSETTKKLSMHGI